MIKLKREEDDKILGKQQWWDVGLNYEALVSFDSELCSISVSDSSKTDISEVVANLLNFKFKKNYKVNYGMSCCYIEVPVSELISVLNEIGYLIEAR
ncbi:hypothetical protein [Spartinivicinus poritis]|uniref:Uncharacterized protein n=1 Tax=Spartinivicinus poritis TaxID=2994640 RepID=A0ABT5UJL8_9GAMM|nr:hypothetical protein [Spartinivicinus sp. A2-2]MDE1465717.1 hypothetical protein [Spartinivicinus sp. A2-2]